jgi:uncharacterized membrane protein YbhN (UPF0104 family)
VSRARNILSTLARLAIGAAVLIYLGSSGSLRWNSLLGLGKSWRLTVLALLCMIANFAFTAWRFCVLLAPLRLRLSLWDSFKLTLIGQFFSTFLPGGTSGDVMKIYHAAEGNEGRRTEVATLVLLDRAVGMFAMLLLPILLAPFSTEVLRGSRALREILWLAGAGAGAMLAGFLLTFSDRVRHSRPLLWIFRTMPLGGYAERIFDTVHQLGRHPLPLFEAVGISLLGQSQTVLILLTLALATTPGEPVARAAIMVPLGLLANTVPLTPGGLGVGEAAFEKLFRIAGVHSGAEAMLSWRLLTTVISLAGLLFYLKGRQKMVHGPEAAKEMETVSRDV